MGKTYTNDINEQEVSLGIEHLLIADYPRSWTPARIDIEAPPAGFYHLGAVVEDSPVLNYSRTYFELDAGLPMVTQYRAVTGMEGTFSVDLHSYSWRKLQYALGNYTATGSFSDESVEAYDGSLRRVTLAGTTSTESLSVNQIVTLTQSATPDDPDAESSRISSLAAGSGDNAYVYLTTNLSSTLSETLTNSGGTLSFQHTPGYTKLHFGGNTIRDFTLLGVVDLIDGTQIVHHIPKASPSGDLEITFRPEQNARIPLSFKALGVNTVINSCTQIIVAESYEFPSLSTC